MNGDQPTEETALLNRPGRRAGNAGGRRRAQQSSGLPIVAPVVARFQPLDLSRLAATNFVPSSLSKHTHKVAFTLVILLQLYIAEKVKARSTRDVWDYWTSTKTAAQNLEQLEAKILDTWDSFLRDIFNLQGISYILFYPSFF